MENDLSESFEKAKQEEKELFDIKVEKDKLVFESPKIHDEPDECPHF